MLIKKLLALLFGRTRKTATQSAVAVSVADAIDVSRTNTALPNVAPHLSPALTSPNLVSSTVIHREAIAPAAIASVVQRQPTEQSVVKADELSVKNCVEFIYDIMDELLPELVESYGDDVDAAIDHAASELKNAYSPAELGNGTRITYDDPVRRFAYLSLYATTRACAMNSILDKLPIQHDLFDRDYLNVCCVGGGPGTDLIGIAKYVQVKQKATRITATICDKYDGWKSSWYAGGNRLPCIEATYLQQDFADPNSWLTSIESLRADLYTLSYCMPEFRNRHGEAEPYFVDLFRRAPHGSYVLFLDVDYSQEYEWFENIVQAEGFRLLPDIYGQRHNSCTNGLLDTEEERAAGRGYRGQHRLAARTNPKVAYRLCIKR